MDKMTIKKNALKIYLGINVNTISLSAEIKAAKLSMTLGNYLNMSCQRYVKIFQNRMRICCIYPNMAFDVFDNYDIVDYISLILYNNYQSQQQISHHPIKSSLLIQLLIFQTKGFHIIWFNNIIELTFIVFNINIFLLMSKKQEWEEIWQRYYSNKSDEMWKTKSLNPEPVEQYPIVLPRRQPSVQIVLKDNKESKKQKVQISGRAKEQFLPSPKMNKINDTAFSISMERDIYVFYLIKNPEEKAKMKIKKTFGVISTTIFNKIQQVIGNNSNLIFVVTKNELIVLELIDSKSNGTKDGIQVKLSIKIPQIRTILAIEKKLIVFTATSIYECTSLFYVDNVRDKLEQICVKKIQFETSLDQQVYQSLNPVGIVVGCNQSFYYFGSKVEEEIDLSKFKGEPGEQQKKVESQFLTIVKLTALGSNKIDGIKAKIFPIDHIFELGIFTRSKIYEIQKQTFLVSLHEEIILVKKNYDRYIVWDNVSVVSSKSQSKKGQLVLVDQSILAYSENIQIFAHQIFYNELESKLSMPPIDNFRGNDNDQQILYDAIMLKDDVDAAVIKVLVYLKPSTVTYPSNQSNIKKKETDPNKMKDQQQQLDFTIICISQSDPKKKLETLISKGKPNSEIETFCKRFNISKQDETKSRWNVSEKKLKDIQNILMQIRQDKFIQQQLDNILKSSSHSLAFLIAVETKQISRLKRLLVEKICLYEQASDSTQDEKYIQLILQWLMQSEMFLKKLNYSKNFLSFKEYDFIEIGKLKASSLKEEIKLLSCKKFQKRLKYYLNSFKNLVISNYEEVFKFLLIGKSLTEIQQFLIAFRFIVPQFKQTSEVFITKKDYGIHSKKMAGLNQRHQDSLTPVLKRQRVLSFAAGPNDDLFFKKYANDKLPQKKETLQKPQKEKEQKCFLWQPFDESEKITQTIQYFQEQTLNQIRGASKTEIGKERASKNFKMILDKFIKKTWFQTAAFKQHSMIPKKTNQIYEQFKQLKRKKAFEILINFLYHKIAEGAEQSQGLINKMLTSQQFKQMIPESFKKNVDARVRVYREVLSKKTVKQGKNTVYLKLPLLEDVIVLSQEEYFQFIFENIRNQVLIHVKAIYDEIQPEFFRQRLLIYLQSDKLKPADIISFCDEFAAVKQGCDDIRLDVFHTIIRLLRLKDKENTHHYMIKSLDREVLPEKDDKNTGKLRQEAKIPFGFYYYHFFRVFDVDYSYAQLINFTNSSSIKDNLLIQEIIRKYCRGEYLISEDYQGHEVCQVYFEESKTVHQNLPTINIHKEPLEFFGLMLHMLDFIDFQITEKEVFDLILENYLNEGKFTELCEFIKKLKFYHVNQGNLKSNNYLMIKDFKEEFDLDQNDRPVISYILSWVKRVYDSVGDKDTLETKLNSVNMAVEMLGSLNKHSVQVKKQKNLYKLLIEIKKFDPAMILNVEKIKREAEHTSFIFMMHRLKQIGVDKFRQYSQRKMQINVISDLSQMFESHKQYAFDQIADAYHKEFIRFLIQLCIIMIEENIFSFAKYLITKRIPNDNYYFKDIIFLFISSIKINQGSQRELAASVSKHILLPETTSLIRQNLEEKIIQAFYAGEFIPIKLEQKKQEPQGKESKEKRPEVTISKTNDYRLRCKLMFQWIMQRSRKDDGFFFLVRSKVLSNDDILEIATQNRKGYGDNNEQNLLKIQQAAYLLVTIYIKALEQFIQRQFYPTFTFFQSKLTLLQDFKERKDIIKDINIAISKLDRIKPSNQKKKHLQVIRTELQKYYNKYMNAIGLNPDIDLVQNDNSQLQGTRRVEISSRKMPKLDILEEQNNKEIQYKKQLQRNLQKINNKQEENRINVMQKEITERITQIKKANQRFNMETDRRDDNTQVNLVEKKDRQLNEIKRKEKEDIQSIKDTYKSDTSKRVNMIIETLKKNREEAVTKMNQKDAYSTNNANYNYKPAISEPSNLRNRNEMIAGMQSPKTDKLTENILPFTMKTKLQRVQNLREEIKNEAPDNRLVQLQKKMFNEKPIEKPVSFKKTVNFEQILKLYRQKQSQEAVKCIQKYDIIKNNQVRGELIKRAYSVTNNFENFLQFLKYLIGSDKTWKETIEEKSIEIAQQMIKMQTKEKLHIKQIIPSSFFTLVTNLSLKDFYNHAFQSVFKPAIKKIFQKDSMAVHAVGILFRYTLGSQNKFYNKVFYEYFKVLFKNFDAKAVDDKQMTLFAEKIRSNFVNLPDSKELILEQLFNSLTNPSKKSRLLQSLKKTLERKGQSLVGGNSNKQIAYVVQKLMK